MGGGLLAGVGCWEGWGAGGACGGGCRAAKGVRGQNAKSSNAQSSHAAEREGSGTFKGRKTRHGSGARPAGAGGAATLQRRRPRARRRRANKITQAWKNTGGGRGCSRHGGGTGRPRQVPVAGPAAGDGYGCCWNCWHRRARRPAAPSGQYGRGGSRGRRSQAPEQGGWAGPSAAVAAAAAVHWAELQLQLARAGQLGDDLRGKRGYRAEREVR